MQHRQLQGGIGQYQARSYFHSMNQLAFYHSVLLVFKVRQSREPRYLNNMHTSWSYSYTTRQAENGLIRVVQKPKLELTRESFRWRAANSYNQLPANIRTCTKVELFKKMVKTWTMENIPIQKAPLNHKVEVLASRYSI